MSENDIASLIRLFETAKSELSSHQDYIRHLEADNKLLRAKVNAQAEVIRRLGGDEVVVDFKADWDDDD